MGTCLGDLTEIGACVWGGSEGSSSLLLDSKAGVCILALFDSKPTFSLLDPVSPNPFAHLLKFDPLVSSFLGHCGKNYNPSRVNGRIQEAGLHPHAPNRAHPPGKRSDSGLDQKQFKSHICAAESGRGERKHCKTQGYGLWR